MPTLHDLRDAFDALEQQAPTEISLRPGSLPIRLDSPSSSPRLRGWAAPLASAAAVAALALGAWGVVSTVERNHSSAPGAVGSSGTPRHVDRSGVATADTPTALTLSFAMAPVAGYSFTVGTITKQFQTQVIGTTSQNTASPSGPANQPGQVILPGQVIQTGQSSEAGTVFVYSANAFNQAAAAEQGKPVTINGHPGFYGPLTDLRYSGGTGLNAVSWQYAADSWAVVQQMSPNSVITPVLTEAAELQIARAVRTGVSSSAKLPFRLTYLPSGVYAVSAKHSTTPTGGEIGLGDGRPASSTTTADFSAPITISVNDTTDPNLVLCPANDPTSVRFPLGSHTGCFARDTTDGQTTGLSVELTRGYLEILLDSNHQGIYSDDQLLQIAAGVVPAANIGQADTWFDANTVVPQ